MKLNNEEIKRIYLVSFRIKKPRIRVNSYKNIELIIPTYSDQFNEEEFILKHMNFIKNKLNRLDLAQLPSFKNNSTVWILGKKYPVYRCKRIQEILKRENGIAIPKSYSLNQIRNYLKNLLYDVIEILTEYYTTKYKLDLLRIEIVNSYSFWSRCISWKEDSDRIEYNLALVFLPLELIEYRIAHELCHIRDSKHTKFFWKHLERIMPDAKNRYKMFREYNLEWYTERLGIRRRCEF